MNSAEKESTALPETEQLIKFLDEHIRNIVREEISNHEQETPNLIREVVKKTPAHITIQKSYLVDVPASEEG